MYHLPHVCAVGSGVLPWSPGAEPPDSDVQGAGASVPAHRQPGECCRHLQEGNQVRLSGERLSVTWGHGWEEFKGQDRVALVRNQSVPPLPVRSPQSLCHVVNEQGLGSDLTG